jgi:putative endonuclease
VTNKIHPKSFTAKYNLTLCVYYEVYTSIEEAIDREKQLKKWNRAKKDGLINSFNKNWGDLTEIINDWDE